MDALGGGLGGLWGWQPPFPKRKPSHSPNKRNRPGSKSSQSVEATGNSGFQFPLKQSLTAGLIATTGDTIAQLRQRWVKGLALKQGSVSDSDTPDKDVLSNLLSDHDWVRSLRIASYGFLLYGPGSYAWYQFLERTMPKQTVENLVVKVLLNQVVLGPCVIAVIFAWNNLWLGKLSTLPDMYRKDALPTLIYGFRFWVPVSVVNFWIVPLHARVAFMSTGAIFWNFYLSSTMNK